MSSITLDRYDHVECRKSEGAHYTPEFMSDFMVEQIISNSTIKKTVNIVDPAIGDGELLISLIKRLIESGVSHINAYGFDTNEQSVDITRDRLQSLYPNVALHLSSSDFLEFCIKKEKKDPKK